ncbi:MAG: polymerase subunit gamma and tau [Nocardioides sp.]|uniref:DNA polymerase III subunit gamma and tau n=1 Tax=Nocardioides sp. TaxID=35761 RepID=UPI00261E198C|nr:DNA polymerase III subunit gamma and tau [Nocardioides sp.]MCW2835410.1 polymerase subunit gamma and tau [Nocardioides sp.]
MESPLALYRRYRPETFAEVIGQDHVTEPLRNALANDRVNHAYLFSGPRGCGKTTSARILARALNCAQAPIADPCGECDSCRELARRGGGSIDVIEIDAASHGGVDDARDLREKAFFSPVRDRFKIYIIDEAHMVSNQGFNALLKLVEEPPPHLRFIFATTEPEKVLPTIRSRTHHYPFRLIPPRQLSDYLHHLCVEEGVGIEPAALPLVVRAGGGSARDALSVLDQLMGGAGADGVTHELAGALLGYTPETLLDEVVDAFAAVDGATVFGVVDKVVETGRDPRRFTEDLLRRLRDLVIVAAVPEAAATGLLDVPQDAGERLVAQAARFGSVELSRAADIVAAGLTEMRGATAPRLLLELICARVLLPGADDTSDGVMARLDRIERRLDVSGAVSTTSDRPRPSPAAAPAPATTPSLAPAPAPAPAAAPAPPSSPSAPVDQGGHQPMFAPPRFDEEPPEEPVEPAPAMMLGEHAVEAAPAVPEPTPAAQDTGPAGSSLSLVDVRRLWPDIVDATKVRRRVTWIHLTQNAQVIAVDATTLTLGFTNAGARESFLAGGSDEILRQAAIDVVGAEWRIEAIIDPSAQPDAGRPVVVQASTDPVAHTRSAAPADETSGPPTWAQEGTAAATTPDSPPAWAAPQADRTDSGSSSTVQTATPSGSAGPSAAREALSRSREPAADPGITLDHRALADEAADPDDPAADTQGLDSTALLQQALGAKVVEEIKHT